MSKEIWLGPLLGNNRARLIERCAELVSQNKASSFLYLAASHPLLEIVTQGILDGDRNRGVWGELPVYLFRGFVRHLISTAVDEAGNGMTARMPIDHEELPLKRSLISQLLLRLKGQGKLTAIAPLAHRDGCVNTIAGLIGEIQRAGKTPEEFAQVVANRVRDFYEGTAGAQHKPRPSQSPLANGEHSRMLPAQIDFDQDLALIYATYFNLLEQNHLSEDDADGLRALQILRDTVVGKVILPRLENVQLLVLDGFFDFTPAQGEMLKLLIPQIPQVVVNLNKDDRNPEIFAPFNSTIDQLSSAADFDIKHSPVNLTTQGALSVLRENLFNPALAKLELSHDSESEDARHGQSEIRYFDCTDRETELRVIAKEIKRLVLLEDYHLSDIALVVRERTSYAETITRVMREEGLPCSLDRRITVDEIPATRAALKLLGVLNDLALDEASVLKMPQLADQIKSGYFRLTQEALDALAAEFEEKFSDLLREGELDGVDRNVERAERRRRGFGIGRWDADTLENVIAYVGADLRLADWLDRCRKLIDQLPSAEATKELLNIDAAEPGGDDDEAQMEDAETVQPEDKHVEKKRRPQRDIHPAVIAWSTLVIKRFAAQLQAVPRQGAPVELRAAIMKLLDQFQFRREVTSVSLTEDKELPRAVLDLHALEGLRRAFLTAIKSLHLTQPAATAEPRLASLTSVIEEVRRCLSSQTVIVGSAERGGLRVLEATDVRGLRFRAVFIAGLIEGGFPLSASRDWIYPHEERERLKHYGLTLEDISPNSLLKEEHYFYQTACRALERLYLTRPLMLEGDAETVASYYIDEVRRAIAPAKLVKEDVVRPDYDGVKLRQASSANEAAISLVRQEQHHLNKVEREGLLPHPQVSALLSLARNDRLLSESALVRIGIERERSGQNFGPYDGQITDPDLLTLIRKRFGPDFVHSASGLGAFGNCAYRFFAQRVLKLEPRGEAALDLQALDAGKLLHDILRRFFEQYRGERLDPARRAELSSELLKIADDVFDLHQQVVPPLNKQVWKLDREIRKIILEQVLLYELDLQEKTAGAAVTPARFELAFGGMKSAARDPASTEEPLRLVRSTFVGEETMKISGQIDRVDIAADKTLVAYDYKLSKGARKEDIYEGRTLQIPIYLEALEQLFFPGDPIAGGGYYTLRGGSERRNTGVYRKDFNDDYLALQAKNSIFSEYEWQQFRAAVTARIWEFLDRMRNGRFTVEPSEGYKTCKFCDYAAVCRYEKYRIDRKKRSERKDTTKDE
ncbi:MAG: hypothetical protein JWM21_618 [Acidobacteria bacterium]|nr:hypothetical protein [Acidobacteriota bacterium]